MSCTQYDTNHITWAKAGGIKFWGIRGEINGIKLYKSSEDMTSQTDNQIGNLCSDFHCSTV